MKSILDESKLPQRLNQERARRGGTSLSLNIGNTEEKPLVQSKIQTTRTTRTRTTATGDIKPQTITDHSKNNEPLMVTDAYPNGPVCVWDRNLYLFSEPNVDQLKEFDVVINVAVESPNLSSSSPPTCEYLKVDWSHSSHLLGDLPRLTQLIHDRLEDNKRVLVHCQCGVSRSATLVMAFIIAKTKCSYNEAHDRLKKIVGQISPNLNLIYELMEWTNLLAGETNTNILNTL